MPAPPSLTVLRPVSTDVNNVRNQGPHLVEPAPEPEPGLFGDATPAAGS